jgi:hypothetical protein
MGWRHWVALLALAGACDKQGSTAPPPGAVPATPVAEEPEPETEREAGPQPEGEGEADGGDGDAEPEEPEELGHVRVPAFVRFVQSAN